MRQPERKPVQTHHESEHPAIDGMAGHLIRRLNQFSTSTFTERVAAAGFDLTPVQFACLETISRDPGIDQATVALRIAYDRATIGGVIDRLVRKGWVSRGASLSDRRAKVLMLTPEGLDLLERIRPIVRGLQRHILPNLNDAEFEDFLLSLIHI